MWENQINIIWLTSMDKFINLYHNYWNVMILKGHISREEIYPGAK